MDILKALNSRKSIRQFSGEKVNLENLDKILNAGRTAPSYVNANQISVVYTKDKDKIAKIAEYCGGQNQVKNCDVFILILSDFYRIEEFLKSKNLGSITLSEQSLKELGAMDAGIVASFMNIAALEFGYGCTMIGGVKRNPEKLKELFNIPEKVNVMLGLTIGIPSEQAANQEVKPKVKLEAFAMEDGYNKDVQVEAFKEYEKVLKEYFDKLGVSQPLHSEVLKNNYIR